MGWKLKLAEPICFQDGRRLVCLSDVRAMILDMPERQVDRPYWRYTLELLLRAAETKARDDIRELTNQIGRASAASGPGWRLARG